MTFELFQEVRSLQNAVREVYDTRPRTRAGLMCTPTSAPRGISHVCLHGAPHYPSSNRAAHGVSLGLLNQGGARVLLRPAMHPSTDIRVHQGIR